MENSTNEMIEMTVKVVLCDIEGTTTSISFVKDTLFPYAKQHVEQFLQDNWDNEQVKNIVSEIRKQSKSDEETKVDGLVAIKSGESDAKDEQIKDVVANLQWQISIDRKTGGLKELQGLIWKKGYEQKTLSGHVYDDVAEAFKKWTTDGLKIYIYSSGSVEAQKLLFGHSEAGDLLSFLSGHFDTKIGHKQETDSYKNILKELNLSGTDVLFLTDVVKEAEAAVNAEMKAIILDRPGNADLTSEDREKYIVAKSFAELKLLANLGLKRKLEAAEGSEQTEVQATKIAKIEEDSNIKAEDKVDNVVTPAVNDVADQKMEDEEMKSVEPIKNSESDDKEKAKEEISEDPKSPDVPNENTKTDDTNSNDILKADEQTESEKTEILDEDSLLNEKTVETEESKNENESTKLNGNEPKIEELETIEKDIEMEEGKISPDQCAEPIVKEPEEKVITKSIEPERLTENIESPEEEEILNKTETVENGESKGDENNSDKSTPIDALCPDETTEADESFLLSDPMKNMEEAEVEKTNGNGTEDNKEMKEDKSIVEAKSVKAEEEAITNLPTKKCSDLSMADSSTIPTNPAIAVEAEN